MDFFDQFLLYIKTHKLSLTGKRLILAVSGGVDSVVLLDCCAKAGFDITIAHCNFQLRGAESDRDVVFVQNLAMQYQCSFELKELDTLAYAEQHKQSIELAARNLRYAWFQSLAESIKLNEGLTYLPYILTGHHADDAIETILMNFFRGTGISGLKGIAVKNGLIIRPLLFARRKAIEAYATENQLQFVQDSTNAEDVYTRNFFRNTLLPQISTVFPAVHDNILHNMHRLAEVHEIYAASIAQQIKKLCVQKGMEYHIPVLKLQQSETLSTLVFEIIRQFNFSSAQVNEVIQLLQSETGKYISSSTHRILKNRNWIIISPLPTIEQSHILVDRETLSIRYPHGQLQFNFQTIEANPVFSTSLLEASINANLLEYPLIVRQWKTGDYFYPLGMKKKKKLSRFMIDQKLSLIQKEKIWVLESNKRIVWVIGQRIDDRFKVTAQTQQILTIQLSVSE